MAHLRSRLPVVLTVGAGFVGYQYIYRSKHREPIQIDDGVSIHRPLLVQMYVGLPLNFASYLWGRVNNIELPVWARKPVFRLYVRMFHCNMSEAAVTDFTQYQNLDEFFRRRLRSGCRPIDQKCPLTCPCDGTVLTCGNVTGDQVEQVKGVTYSLNKFLGPPDWPKVVDRASQSPSSDDYVRRVKSESRDTQLYQAVIYLAPGNYHGFHSPTEWTVVFRRYFPGLLLSVNPRVARWVSGLLALNERVVYIGRWEHGFMAMAAVGATNVGSIQVYHDPQLCTNSQQSSGPCSDLVFQSFDCLQPLSFKRGDAFGEFNLGSTIVVLFEAPKNFRFTISPGQRVKYGQTLGRL